VTSTDERINRLEAQVARLLDVVAERDATIAKLNATIAKLNTRVAELEEKLGQNSSNSNKPPSSDPPGAGGAASGGGGERTKASGRKRGGQPGHGGSRRTLVPADEVDALVDCFPPRCACCARRLTRRPDPDALRHQVTEVPQVKPHVTEYRQHAVACSCGHVTRGSLPGGVSSVPFGARLIALAAALVGVYKLSRRAAQALLWEMLGVRISLGAISTCERRTSDALAAAHDEALAHARDAPIKHIDATSWYEARKYMHVWTLVTAAATVFRITRDGTTDTVRSVLGRIKGVLVSDRATAFLFWRMSRRQICWAHLLRKFVSFSEKGDEAGRIGTELLDYATLVFTYWHQLKDGKIDRRRFRKYLRPIRSRVETLLRRGSKTGAPRMSGSCEDILKHRAALWTFVDHEGIEPTNNHAERALRAAVIWRKTSLGTQSERGSRFVERILTATYTLRQHKRDVLGYLRDAVHALMHGAPSPALIPAHAS
jgi:transposase